MIGRLSLLVVLFALYAQAQWVTVEDLNFSNGVGLWRYRGTVPPVGRCGGYNVLGGVYGLSGSSEILQWGPYSYQNAYIRSFTVTMTIMGIDSWDATVSAEKLYIQYNNQITVGVYDPDHRTANLGNACGSGWPDTARQVSFTVTPNAPIESLTFRMFSTLDQGRDDESWGISSWRLQVIPSCDPCRDNNNQQCNGDHVATCVNSGICQRTCNCPWGYTGTAQLSNNAAFGGCRLINYCNEFGNQQCNGKSFATCSATGPGLRTCTCPDAYTGTAQLSQNNAFGGCVAKSGCATYGPNGSNGRSNNVIGCTDAFNSRTVTCAAGYYAVAPNIASITLVGEAQFPGCVDIDECTVYGNSGKPSNVQGCTNVNVNQRRLVCNPGYFAVAPDVNAITLTGSASFAGCTDINECAEYGYSGKSANAAGCTDGVNIRTITCNTGYYAVAPTNPVISLVGNAPFNGCVDIDECAVYGYSGKNNAASCTQPAINQRTITCAPGYFAIAPSNPSVTLNGAASFGGCSVIDMCAVYGFSGNNRNTLTTGGCVNVGVNQRRITCADGFAPIGGNGGSSITLTGPTAFAGCAVESPCTVHGYSGRSANTLSCTNVGNTGRTITCQPGYYAVAPSTPTVTLQGDAVFTGCVDIDECAVYGNSGRGTFVAGCSSGINTRTITCNAGYAAQAPATRAITLTGNAQFLGCIDIKECEIYSFSNKAQNTASCVEQNANQRTITCKDGYFAVAPDTKSITLSGSDTFIGCTQIDTCRIYGFSGQSGNTLSCVGGVNTRTITCNTGFYAVAPATPSITLTGNAAFGGCTRLDTCTVFGYSGKTNNTVSCTSGLNTRTIRCATGYYAVSPDVATVTLTGSAEFNGCTDINECQVYGYSNKPANTASCVHSAVNSRTITCAPGYYAIAPTRPSIVLVGASPFTGCTEINECVVYGNSSKPQYVQSCTEGINRRNITCVDGAAPVGFTDVKNAPRSIVLTGDTPFKGCQVVCGNGKKTEPETCDDGNTEDGDGCNSKCEIEPGWVCNWPGSPCCRYYHRGEGVNIVSQHDMYCYHGYWMPFGYNRTQALVIRDWLVDVTEDTVLCGDFVFDTALRITDATLRVHGSVTLGPKGELDFHNNSRLEIYPPCLGTYDKNEVNFRILDENSTITLSNFNWEDSEETPVTPIWTELCTEIQGTLQIIADEIPQGSNDFALITSNSSCNGYALAEDDDVFHEEVPDLPDGCSNFEVTGEEEHVIVTLNRKTLCPGQIAGITVGVVAFVGVVLAGAAVALGGGAGGAGGDTYVAL